MFTGIKYSLEDCRLTNPTRRRWFKRTRGEDASLFSLDEGRTVFLGLAGRLWRLHDWPGTWWLYTYIRKDPAWFSKLKTPRLELSVASSNPGKWTRTNEYKFELDVCHAGRETRGLEFRAAAHYAWLENVNHVLVRIQRWAKRMLRQARVRLVLLMALHPRLGAKAGIAELGPDIILDVVARAGTLVM